VMGLAVLGLQLDSILKVFTDLNNSMINQRQPKFQTLLLNAAGTVLRVKTKLRISR